MSPPTYHTKCGLFNLWDCTATEVARCVDDTVQITEDGRCVPVVPTTSGDTTFDEITNEQRKCHLENDTMVCKPDWTNGPTSTVSEWTVTADGFLQAKVDDAVKHCRLIEGSKVKCDTISTPTTAYQGWSVGGTDNRKGLVFGDKFCNLNGTVKCDRDYFMDQEHIGRE